MTFVSRLSSSEDPWSLRVLRSSAHAVMYLCPWMMSKAAIRRTPAPKPILLAAADHTSTGGIPRMMRGHAANSTHATVPALSPTQ